LAKLVAPNPRDRFRSAKDARAALDKLGRGSSAVVKLPGTAKAPTAARPRRRWLRELALAASVLVGVGGFATLAKHRKHRAEDRLSELYSRFDRDDDRDDPDDDRGDDRGDDRRRSRGPRPDRLHRAGRAVTAFAALTEDMCGCRDRRCVDAVAA